MEVAQVWNHVPLSWHAQVDHTLVETTADLIKLASDKEEQLQAMASSADQIQRLVRAELQQAQAGGDRVKMRTSTPSANSLVARKGSKRVVRKDEGLSTT